MVLQVTDSKSNGDDDMFFDDGGPRSPVGLS